MTNEEELAEIRAAVLQLQAEGLLESEIRGGERYYGLTLAGRLLAAIRQLEREPSVWH